MTAGGERAWYLLGAQAAGGRAQRLIRENLLRLYFIVRTGAIAQHVQELSERDCQTTPPTGHTQKHLSLRFISVFLDSVYPILKQLAQETSLLFH